MKAAGRPLWKHAVIAFALVGTTFLHWVTPVGPHHWFWLHVVAQRLYYVPILLAAGWFSGWAAGVVTLTASVLYLTHVFGDWHGYPMIEFEQAASVGTFWLVMIVASTLFSKIRTALVEIRDAHEETLTALASSLELRERYTAGHSQRVRSYTLLLANRLGIKDDRTLAHLSAGALFHDIGKIGIPDDILLKEGSLEPEELALMKTHPEKGGALVGKVRSLTGARGLIESHHERFDGSGYPRGLSGEAIPLGARLFAVADTLDAMTTTRSYRPALTYDEAVQAIKDGSGTQFDPHVVQAFLDIPFGAWAAEGARFGVVLNRGGTSARVELSEPNAPDRPRNERNEISTVSGSFPGQRTQE
jgi:hypothetical protein